MRDSAPVPIILVGTIFLCSTAVLKLSASPSTSTETPVLLSKVVDEENVEPQTSLNGYYVDSLNEIASAGIGYVRS